MRKILSVLLSLSLFLSLFFISAHSASAEEIEEIEEIVDVEIVEIPQENELFDGFESYDDLDEIENVELLEENNVDSISIGANLNKAERLGLPNAINVTTKTVGDYTEVYASNIGIDTVDTVTSTLVVKRYDHNKNWVKVREVTMNIKNLAPGKKLMKKIYNPQNYGYEKQILSFVAKDGKSVTSDSAENTRIKNPYNWKDIKTLADHTYRHAGDFGLSYNEMTYSKKANTHYTNRKNTGYEYFTGTDGNIRVYQASTNSFGSYDSTGKTRTYYKPSSGKVYWENQIKQYKK